MNEQEFKPYKTDSTGDHFKHPTFGAIAFARGQGTPRPLFGSSILHQNIIRLEISHAEVTRDLNRDWIHSRNPIVEVEMSTTQFADAITGLNDGSGVPVTIRYIAGGETQRLSDVNPPYQNKIQQFNKEFENHIADLSKDFDEAINLAKETKAQKRLVSLIEKLRMQFKSNLPFINESFSEQMEHTIKEAKGEVEGFVTHMVQSYGIEAIRKQAPQLPEAIDSTAKELPEGTGDAK